MEIKITGQVLNGYSGTIQWNYSEQTQLKLENEALLTHDLINVYASIYPTWIVHFGGRGTE